jgi:hypothetical protein
MPHMPVPPSFEEFRNLMFHEFLAAKYLDMRRVSQHLFSTVLMTNPRCAERIRGTESDPFLGNSRISSTWRAIEARWAS